MPVDVLSLASLKVVYNQVCEGFHPIKCNYLPIPNVGFIVCFSLGIFPKKKRRPMRKRKHRPLFSPHQIQTMEKEFAKQRYVTEDRRARLASEVNLTETQVKTRFQNRRTKWKKEIKDEANATQLRRTLREMEHVSLVTQGNISFNQNIRFDSLVNIRSQFCRHNIVMYRCFRLSTLKVRILHNFIPLVCIAEGSISLSTFSFSSGKSKNCLCYVLQYKSLSLVGND